MRDVHLEKRKHPNLPSRTALLTADNALGISDLDGIAQSANGLAVSPVKRRSRKKFIVPCLTALVIGSFSIAEILEGGREIFGRRLHHGHGMAILAIIRLCRSIAILQTQMDELKEGTEKLGINFEKTEGTLTESSLEAGLMSIPTMLARFVFSPLVTISACILAAVASILEIFEDTKPGAHHGAALLALSELNYQLGRLQHVTGKRLTMASRWFPAEVASSILAYIPLKAKQLLSRFSLGAGIAIAAAGFAAVEIVEDMQPGAHHAVAVLAAAEFVENINRSRVLKQS